MKISHTSETDTAAFLLVKSALKQGYQLPYKHKACQFGSLSNFSIFSPWVDFFNKQRYI